MTCSMGAYKRGNITTQGKKFCFYNMYSGVHKRITISILCTKKPNIGLLEDKNAITLWPSDPFWH